MLWHWSCMFTDGRLVAYVSRTLTDMEACFAQIEKDLLAVVFACSKFRDYIYGKATVVKTDHQPLVTILRKPIRSAPAHLQSMPLQLQAYGITLIYKKGKHIYLADTLLRSPDTSASRTSATPDKFEVMSVSYSTSQQPD